MSSVNMIKCDVSGCPQTIEVTKAFLTTPDSFSRVYVKAKKYDVCAAHMKEIQAVLDGEDKSEPEPCSGGLMCSAEEHLDGCFSQMDDSAEIRAPEGVHITHCCPVHGCKYGNRNCPIKNGLLKPRYSRNNGCEQCEAALATIDDAIQRLREPRKPKDINAVSTKEVPTPPRTGRDFILDARPDKDA